MKPTFLQYAKPLLTGMVQDATPDDAIRTIMNCHYDGADAFGIQLECLERQYRTPENLKRIFDQCMGKPIYITSYRNGHSTGMTDEECVELLLMGLDAGATLCDVIGDLFDPSPMELTRDSGAIARQMELIDTIHARGGEVLMSSHTFRFMDGDQVLEFAAEQKRRGADVAKIVSWADTREELETNMNSICRLRRELGIPFLFLAGGACCRPQRQLGPSFGVCMYLCVHQYRPGYSLDQPLLRSMKAARDNLLFLP